tara:strand:+ start:599 stop:1390 length:792 start_codon:yes stop_codon:yes gene_type:complete
MKRFSDYIHSEATIECEETQHLILYGNNNIDNYCYALNILKKKSKTELKYSRRIAIRYNANDMLFNISDIHIEVDFHLLGVSEYNIFLELFTHVKENIAINKKEFYIVCLNFHNIKPELLSIFYTFLDEECVQFIFLTSKISFVCDKILQRTVIKKVNGSPPIIPPNIEQNVLELALFISQDNKKPFFYLRELLYKFLVLNLDIHDCFQKLIVILIEKEYITFLEINKVLKEYSNFISKYNNNYRPIYHLESYIVFLINLKNS